MLVSAFSYFGFSKENRNPAATRTISYYQDKTIVVPQKINRIASGWNAQNSIIAMLGYGDKIVATTEMIKKSPVFGKFSMNALKCNGMCFIFRNAER
jgi:ABC-type Fe3+-hydroxamate transport system substrate-binding protein